MNWAIVKPFSVLYGCSRSIEQIFAVALEFRHVELSMEREETRRLLLDDEQGRT
jgi:hypothetical protein